MAKARHITLAERVKERARENRKAESMARLQKHPKIEEVEDGGMDEGRFFVHLRKPWKWNDDPAHLMTSRSFGSFGEARRALVSDTVEAPDGV